jgi:hypothetical protein
VNNEQERAPKNGRKRRHPKIGELDRNSLKWRRMPGELAEKGLEPEQVPGGDQADGKKPLISGHLNASETDKRVAVGLAHADAGTVARMSEEFEEFCREETRGNENRMHIADQCLLVWFRISSNASWSRLNREFEKRRPPSTASTASTTCAMVRIGRY